jgi:alpha-glucoside transport system substrate-binding protein
MRRMRFLLERAWWRGHARALRPVALVAALTLVLAGCFGDGGGGGGGETGGGEGGQESSAKLADLSGQSLTVASRWSGGEQQAFQKVLDAFTEQTGADVTYEATGDDAAAFLGGRIAGGNPPDVAVISNPGLLRDLASQGNLKEIEQAAGEQVDANFAPIWRELGSAEDGKLYGVWYKAANKSTFWYSPQVFETAGVEPPQTWEDLVSAAETIAASGVQPIAIGAADGWVLTDWFENVYIRVAGGDKYDQLTNHEIPWTDPSVATALERLAEIWGNNQLIMGGARGALQTAYPDSVSQTFTDPPGAGMVYEADFVANVIRDETQATLGEDADFFPFPSIEGSEPSVIAAGDVAMVMTDNPAAQEFIKYLATPEAAEIWAEQGGFISPNNQVDLGVYADDIMRRAAEEVVKAEELRFDMSDLTPPAFGGTPGQGMWAILQDFLRNPRNVQQTQQALEQAAAQAYK